MDKLTKLNKNSELCKLQGIKLVLTSINCIRYKPTFDKYGINERTLLSLTANDLRYMDVNDEDIPKIMKAINILSKTINLSEIRLTNDEILKLQSNICGQLGYLSLLLNIIYKSISKNKKHFEDKLIDNYLSSVDASLMVKPYLKAEENNIEKRLKKMYKIKENKRTILIITTVCTALLFGFALHRSNYSFNTISAFNNLVSRVKSLRI